jgi:hypothetical protein
MSDLQWTHLNIGQEMLLQPFQPLPGLTTSASESVVDMHALPYDVSLDALDQGHDEAAPNGSVFEAIYHGSDICVLPCKMLSYSDDAGDDIKLSKLLHQGFDLDAVNAQGESAFVVAARYVSECLVYIRSYGQRQC